MIPGFGILGLQSLILRMLSLEQQHARSWSSCHIGRRFQIPGDGVMYSWIATAEVVRSRQMQMPLIVVVVTAVTCLSVDVSFLSVANVLICQSTYWSRPEVGPFFRLSHSKHAHTVSLSAQSYVSNSVMIDEPWLVYIYHIYIDVTLKVQKGLGGLPPTPHDAVYTKAELGRGVTRRAGGWIQTLNISHPEPNCVS